VVARQGFQVLIDTGPDLRQQLLRAQLDDIQAVLMTHEHQDHTAGLDELRAVNFQQGHTVPIYGTPPVLRRLRQQYAYIFENSGYPGLPQIELRELPMESFSLGPLEITPLPAWHGQLPVVGYRVGKVAYLTDVNRLPAATLAKLAGLEVLFLDALHRRPHHSHFHLDAAIEQAQAIGARRTYFLHISHHMGRHADVLKELPPGIELAWDGLTLP
jgi:phosphoribosyl 1,2-cyclic phosphate phosphodiesterase